MLAGPVRIAAGATAAYTLQYTRVPVERDAGTTVVFLYRPGATLLRVDVLEGAPLAQEEIQNPGWSERVAFAGDAGKVQFTLRFNRSAVGSRTVSVYVPGTNVGTPDGSVTEMTTDVTAPMN